MKYYIFFIILLTIGSIGTAQVNSGDFTHESSINQELASPLRMAIDHTDNLYVTDVVKRCIHKFDPSGNFLQTVYNGGYPISLALNYQNSLFFGDGATGSIFKVNSDGSSTLFYNQAQFPSSLTFDADGNMYVADSKQKKVLVINPEGQLINTIGDEALIYPTGIAYDERNNRIVVAEHGAARYVVEIKIYIFNLDGTMYTSFSSYGDGDGQLYRAQGVSVGRCGNIYIVEPFQGEVNVFSPDGTYITRFGEYGTAAGQFNVPVDVVFNSEDKVIASSMNNGKIEVYTISDNFPSSNMRNSNVTICEGDTASLPVRFTGTAPWTFTYVLDGGNPVTVSNTFENPYIIRGTQPGTYQITELSDANYISSCITSNATVSHIPAPWVDFSLTSVPVSSGEQAVIPMTFTGTPPWSFTYTQDGLNPQTISGILTNNYDLTVSDPGYYQANSLSDLNCSTLSLNSGTFVNVNTNPTAKIIGSNFSVCEGDSVIIPIEFTGTAPWTFTYTKNNVDPVTVSGNELNPYFLKVASSGIYRVSALSDAFSAGTLFIGTATVVINSLPSATLLNSSISVCEGTPAQINVQLTGTAPWNLTYQVDGGNIVSEMNISTNSYGFESYLTGTHSLLSVTDANCSVTNFTGTSTVSHYSRPTSLITTSSATICNGQSATFEIELTGTAPWTISYSNNSSAPVTISGITQSSYSVDVSEQGSYSVISVNDAFCDATTIVGSYVLSIWDLPTAAITSSNSTICEGSSTDLTIEFSGTAPWSVTYTNNGIDPVTTNDITNSIFSIPVSQSGTYELLNVSDVNCSITNIPGSLNVTVNPLPVATFGFGSHSVCQGERVDIPVHFSGTAPWSFTYSKNNSNPITVNSLQEQDFIIVTYVDGIYELLSASDANCSTAFSGNTAQVLVKTLPTATLAMNQFEICDGNSVDLSVEFTGIAPWSFSYSKDGTTPVDIVSVDQSPYTFPVNEAGTYQLTSVADSSCAGTSFFGISTVNVKSLPTSLVSSPDAALCNGENANIDFEFTGIPPYNFTYTDGLNSVSIIDFPENMYSFSVSEAGIYEITQISDASCIGNQMTGSTNVTMNSLPSATITENYIQTCPTDSAIIPVNLTGNAPWSLTYTRNGINPVTINNIFDPNVSLSILDPGEYEIISVSDAIDNGNCFYGTSIVEHLPTPASFINNSYPYFCEGEMANVSVTLTGTPPWSFTYTIDGNNPVTVNTASNVYYIQSNLPGLYEVSEVLDVFCPGTNTGSSLKILNSPVTASITDDVVTVPEGTIVNIPVYFTGDAPWNIQYSKDGIFMQTILNITDNPYNLSVSEGGIYTISYVYNENCGGTGQGSFVVNSFPLPTSDIPQAEFAICPGETAPVTINFTGNGPWTFTYTQNNSNPVTINNVSSSSYILNITEPGNYEVIALSDVNFAGTTLTGVATVTLNALPSATITTANSSFCEGSSTNMNIALTGTAPWSVTYNQDGSNPVTVTDIFASSYDISISSIGTYNLTAISDANCTGTNLNGSITVTQNSLPTAAVTTTSSTICDGSSAIMNVTLTGTAPWSITYTLDGANPVTVNDINTNSYDIAISTAGTYALAFVSDVNCSGNEITGAMLITAVPDPVPAFSYTANALEVSFANNSINADSYLWNFGDGTFSTDVNPVYTYLQDGTYNVFLTASSAYCGDSTISISLVITNVLTDINNYVSKIDIFPNPSSGLINYQISYNNIKSLKFEIYDVRSNLVLQKVINKTSHFYKGEINLSGLSSGFYVLKIISDSEFFIKNFIITE